MADEKLPGVNLPPQPKQNEIPSRPRERDGSMKRPAGLMGNRDWNPDPEVHHSVKEAEDLDVDHVKVRPKPSAHDRVLVLRERSSTLRQALIPPDSSAPANFFKSVLGRFLKEHFDNKRVDAIEKINRWAEATTSTLVEELRHALDRDEIKQMGWWSPEEIEKWKGGLPSGDQIPCLDHRIFATLLDEDKKPTRTRGRHTAEQDIRYIVLTSFIVLRMLGASAEDEPSVSGLPTTSDHLAMGIDIASVYLRIIRVMQEGGAIVRPPQPEAAAVELPDFGAEIISSNAIKQCFGLVHDWIVKRYSGVGPTQLQAARTLHRLLPLLQVEALERDPLLTSSFPEHLPANTPDAVLINSRPQQALLDILSELHQLQVPPQLSKAMRRIQGFVLNLQVVVEQCAPSQGLSEADYRTVIKNCI